MSSNVFEAFEARAKQVAEYMAGCGQKYGMPCTCGPGCRCANCSEHCKMTRDPPGQNQQIPQPSQQQMSAVSFSQHEYNQMPHMGGGAPPSHLAAPSMNYGDFVGAMGYGNNAGINVNVGGHNGMEQLSPLGGDDDLGMPSRVQVEMPMRGEGRRASRNPSIISFGGVRGMSVTSEATFGRAMSGLSALSIDWENLEDFDVNVDHSAHINNSSAGGTSGSPGNKKDADN
jgi:hypothetical protein